jgi:hypothetical protein
VRVAIAIAVVIQTTNGFAQPEAFVAPTRGAQLFTEGRELVAAGKIDEACARFEVSWRTERATGTQVNLADCRERQGKLLEAWRLFDEAARISDREGNSTRATFARNRAASIDARLMFIDVRLASPIAAGTRITIDGKRLDEQSTRMDPKSVRIRATAPGGTAFVVEVPAQGGRVVVDVPSLVRTTTVRRASRLWIAGGLVVGSVVGLVTAQRLWMYAEDQRDVDGCTVDEYGNRSCVNQDTLDRAEHQADLAARNDAAAKLVLGGSVLALVGAAVIWYTAPKERVLITPTATTSSVGVSLAARF